jgi:hypothetical protein
MRLDSGNDSQDNFPDVQRDSVDFIIKRNLRRESPTAWLDVALRCGQPVAARKGKRVWIGKTTVGINGQPLPCPIVFKVIERTMALKKHDEKGSSCPAAVRRSTSSAVVSERSSKTSCTWQAD